MSKLVKECTIKERQVWRIDSDVNGNPRYVMDWMAFGDTYTEALKVAKRFGGKKFDRKLFGGGIVFSSYNIHLDIAEYIK